MVDGLTDYLLVCRAMAGTKEGDVMDPVLQKLRSKLHQRRIIIQLIQTAALSIFIGALIFVFSTEVAAFISAGIVFIAGLCVSLMTGSVKAPAPEEITRYLDRNYSFTEESASLLTTAVPLGLIAQWQKEKITSALRENADQIKIPITPLKKAVYRAGLLMTLSLGLIIAKPGLIKSLNQSEPLPAIGETLKEQTQSEVPSLTELQIKVTPPAYTNLKSRKYGFENISVPDQSRIEWSFKGNEVESASVLFSGGEVSEMNAAGDDFSLSMRARENRIYQIQLSNADTTVLTSFKSIEVINDQPPGFAITKPFTKRDFITPNKNIFEIEAEIGDDYGIVETEIRATLARGSGENVRFREQTFSFETVSGIGSKSVKASAALSAEALDMKPGDELYFYITATDNNPEPQTARSDTYFIIYADSGEVNAIEIAGLGVDLLPEYFRSQRQIIIDTEQLLKDEPDISREEFNRRSENIGFDQNLLRQRYGAYLGQEDEMASSQTEPFEGEEEHGGSHDHDQEEDEINEMGLSLKESDAASIIPDEFFHDHGAAEMNTLFAESPRTLLKQALANMWNAELYLRTRQPKKALPYEYAALEYLKAVQQANRQYTRKAGYTLPPIDEDEKRLTGTFGDFANPDALRQTDRPDEPLVKLQLLIRDGVISASALAEEATRLIMQAELTDANRLFLLNRIRLIENEGRDQEAEQQIIQRITELSNDIQLDPTPQSYPSLRKIQSPK